MMLPDVSFRCYTMEKMIQDKRESSSLCNTGRNLMDEMTGIKRDNRTLPETVASCTLRSISITQHLSSPKKIYF